MLSPFYGPTLLHSGMRNMPRNNRIDDVKSFEPTRLSPTELTFAAFVLKYGRKIKTPQEQGFHSRRTPLRLNVRQS